MRAYVEIGDLFSVLKYMNEIAPKQKHIAQIYKYDGCYTELSITHFLQSAASLPSLYLKKIFMPFLFPSLNLHPLWGHEAIRACFNITVAGTLMVFSM